MKRLIFSGLAFLYVFSLPAQNADIRVAEVQFNSTTQEGVSLSGTYGEGIVNSEVQGDVIIVHGLYSGIMPDTATGVIKPEPLQGVHTFPNPIQGELVLTTENTKHTGYRVTLLAENGIELRDWLWLAEETQLVIHLRSWPPGMYFVRVNDKRAGQESLIKVVKLE